MKKPLALALSVVLGGSPFATAQAPYSPVAPMPMPMPATMPGGVPMQGVPMQGVMPMPGAAQPAPMPAPTAAPMAPSGDVIVDVTDPTVSYVFQDGVVQPRVYASTEAMLWWLQPAPLSTPTLTTFKPNTPSANNGFGGAIGFAGTETLSPQHLGYGPAIAGRLTVGTYLDNNIGLEATGFLTETANSTYAFSSPTTGIPLRVPFVNQSVNSTFPLGESSFILAADPKLFGGANGTQIISSASQMWGTEANALFPKTSVGRTNVSWIVGARYLDLKEDLNIASSENVPGLGTYIGRDAYGTRNQFFGGQLGVRAELNDSILFFRAQAKLAFGWNHESITTNGISTADVPGLPMSAPGGIFTQPSSIGRQTSDIFAIIPTLQLNAGVNITSRLRAMIGYDILYISDVVRPGNQIDRTINFTQNPVVTFGQVPNDAPTRPLAQFNHTDFWAQGVSFGLEYRY